MALSDLSQGCYNKSDTVMIQLECYKVDNTSCNNICYIMIVTTLLEQPSDKSNNINKLVTSCLHLAPN